MPQVLRAVVAGELWAPAPYEQRQTLFFRDGVIHAIEPGSPAHIEGVVLDAKDGIVIPGLVDLQVNGASGRSFQVGERAFFDEICAYHLRRGTTTLLPTLVTAPPDLLITSLAALAEFAQATHSLSIPGVHLEGPFLSPERSGAHDPAALRAPDLALMQRFIGASAGSLKIVTLAPELPGSEELIRLLANQGILVSAGHTTATYRQLQAACEAGLRMATHMGNASDWPHRAPNEAGFLGSEPGLVGAFLAIPELCGSIILDGFHFHPALVKPLAALKGRDQLVLISDAAPVTGLPPGEYTGGGLVAQIHPEGFATSGRGGGWLAGSIITLLEAVQRAVQMAGIPLEQVLPMATSTPARLIGLKGRKGELARGTDADLLVLNRDLSLRHVISHGCLVDCAGQREQI